MVVAAFETKDPPVEGITDSKKLTPKRREELAPILTKEADYVSFGWVEPWEIDEWGMAKAWQTCCTRTLIGAPEFELLLVDGTDYVRSYIDMQRSEPKGDLNYWQIGAASIIAKRMRDVEMEGLAVHYPGYGWEKNAGYGTKEHYAGLDEHGMTKEHRRLFLRKWKKRSTASPSALE
jgi:ribonuclease HII